MHAYRMYFLCVFVHDRFPYKPMCVLCMTCLDDRSLTINLKYNKYPIWALVKSALFWVVEFFSFYFVRTTLFACTCLMRANFPSTKANAFAAKQTPRTKMTRSILLFNRKIKRKEKVCDVRVRQRQRRRAEVVPSKRYEYEFSVLTRLIYSISKFSFECGLCALDLVHFIWFFFPLNKKVHFFSYGSMLNRVYLYACAVLYQIFARNAASRLQWYIEMSYVRRKHEMIEMKERKRKR